jgi:pilus assembly protein CpaB
MILRLALFALLALGLAGFGMVAWISTRPTTTTEASAAPVPPPAPVKVLVAAHPLRAGSLLKPDDVVAADMVAAKVPEGASLDTPPGRAQLWGAMVRRSLGAGEPVLPADVVRPGDHGFLAAVLGPNMRAITIGVDMISGSAGLIWPGDRVDLILTQAIDAPTLPSGRRLVAETVLSDIRVIAVDQHLIEGATPDAAEPKAARTVTLEVTTGQAERVSVAERLGHLSLVVRSADQVAATGTANPGGDTAPAPKETWAGDVSPALNNLNTPEHGVPSTVRVFQGPSDGKEFRF